MPTALDKIGEGLGSTTLEKCFWLPGPERAQVLCAEQARQGDRLETRAALVGQLS